MPSRVRSAVTFSNASAIDVVFAAAITPDDVASASEPSAAAVAAPAPAPAASRALTAASFKSRLAIFWVDFAAAASAASAAATSVARATDFSS